MGGFSACTADNSYNIPITGTTTVHPVATVLEWDDSTSGYTTVDRIQCGSVRLGDGGVFM